MPFQLSPVETLKRVRNAMPKLSKVACRLSPSHGLSSEHSERGQKKQGKIASYGCGNARREDKRTEERELCVDETRLKINKANVCNNKIYAHYVIWGGFHQCQRKRTYPHARTHRHMHARTRKHTLTQFSKELNSQSSIDEEQQHEEQTQIPHLDRHITDI